MTPGQAAPDFAKEMLILIRAEAGSAGCRATVTSVTATRTHVNVRVVVTQPPGAAAAVMSAPFTVIAVPRSNKTVTVQ
jgi:hypothetical protein